MDRKVAVAILAAGKGTRMNREDIPKVCNPLLGKPLIQYVVDQARGLAPDRIVCIIGHQKEKVMQALEGQNVEFAIQHEQLGTGHAVLQTAPQLGKFGGDLVVLSGDVPRLRTHTLQRLLEKHQRNGYGATVLTAIAPDPGGYGRVLRSADGLFDRVVEHKDAAPEIRKIQEINSGIYVFDNQLLFRLLPRLGNENAQGEYYLPDIPALIQAEGRQVGVEISETFSEIQGINTVTELHAVEELLKHS